MEIVACREPSNITTQSGDNIILHKYIVSDAYLNKAELVKWGDALEYRTGQRLYIKKFITKIFNDTIQICLNSQSEFKLIN
jgi:hypothetical protein